MKTGPFPLVSILRGVIVAALFTFAGLVSNADAATVTTDQLDYPPGSTATIYGTGFTPEAIVTLQVLHNDGHASDGEDHDPWNVTSDTNGNFTTTWFVCTDD